jgi:uroporphyrinogen decarboxylase
VARKFLYNDPAFAHKLMDKITESTISYLKNQIAAGANIVQVFDSWAGILPANQYDDFSLKYISKIADAIDEVPVIVFAKGAYGSRKTIGKINCEVVGLDWNMDIHESRALVGPDKTLQGNLDPAVLYADYSTIKEETRKMIDAFGRSRHIANLGHGVYPDMDASKVKCFIDEIKEYSSR